MNKTLFNKPVTTLLQKIMLIIFGLFCLFCAIELFLRVAAGIFTYQQFKFNQISLQKNGVFRIMCVGESTTFGGNEAYPRQLEEILNKSNLGIQFSVINKGIEE